MFTKVETALVPSDNLTGCSLKCPAVNCQDEQVFGNCGALLLHPRELLKKLLLAGRPTSREIQKNNQKSKKKMQADSQRNPKSIEKSKTNAGRQTAKEIQKNH